MMLKNIKKVLKNPRLIKIRYERGKKRKQEIVEDRKKEEIEIKNALIDFNAIDFSTIDLSRTSLIEQLSQYLRIYGFKESGKDAYFLYGIDNKKLAALLIILKKIAEHHSIPIIIQIKNIEYPISNHDLLSLYRQLFNKESFIIHIESSADKDTLLHFQIGDISEDEKSLIFRGNMLYKKQVFADTIENGFVDLQVFHQHFYPSQMFWDEPVDIVYTWVNGDDHEWQTKILQYKTEKEIDFDRYKETDELKYSLRSLDLHMPWVRNIYILTNCQKPSWINTKNKKIHWILHEEVFPDKTYLPTFNSHAIESCLHRIGGLNEHFIYFNDDVFVMKDVKKSAFFKSNGCSVSFMEPYGMAFYSRKNEYEGYIDAALNGKKLLEKTFHVSPVQFHRHTPHALKKSVLEEMETLFPESYHTVRLNRFRSKSDISTVSFLYHHFAFYKKESVRGGCNGHLIRSDNYRRKSRVIQRKTPHFICINDGGGSHEDIDFKIWMKNFLETHFPIPAPWENND